MFLFIQMSSIQKNMWEVCKLKNGNFYCAVARDGRKLLGVWNVSRYEMICDFICFCVWISRNFYLLISRSERSQNVNFSSHRTNLRQS